MQKHETVAAVKVLRNDSPLFVAYRQLLVQRGFLELPLNLKRNHISFSHTDHHIEKTLEAAEEVLGSLN